MKPDRHQRARDLFAEASQLTGEQRAALIAEKAGDDLDLRNEVETLLRFHDTGTLIMQAPTTSFSSSSTETAGKPRPVPTSPTQSLTLFDLLKRRRKRILIAALIAGVFFAAMFWVHRGVQQSLQRILGNQLENILKQQISTVEMWLESKKTLIETWTRNSEVRKAIQGLSRIAEAKHLAASPLQQSLKQELDELGGTRGNVRYAVWNRERTLIADLSMDPKIIGRSESETGASRLARVFNGDTVVWMPRRRFITKGYKLKKGRKPSLAIVAPVWEDKKVVAALMIAGYGLQEEFEEILKTGRFGDTGESYAFNEEGFLVSESRFNQQLRSIGMLANDETSYSATIIRIADPGGNLIDGYQPDAEQVDWPLTKMAASAVHLREKKSDDLEQDLNGYRDYRGVRVVGVWKWLPEYDIGITTEVDFDSAYRPMVYVGRAVTGVLLTIAVAIVLTVFLWMRVLRLQQRAQNLPRIGAYLLGDLIGEGGMGQVFRAEHELLKRETAVKLMRPEITSTEAMLRFRREMQLASRLTSGHTIKVYDFGETEDARFFAAMEYIEGITLADLVAREGAIPPARAVHFLNQACLSLAEAHQMGLVHRDIKPQNMMICDRAGEPDTLIVLDFGLAKQTRSDQSTVTSSSVLIGTPEYMAPERIRDPAVADPRSDLYSLGATAYNLITGLPVFDAKSELDILDQALHGSITPPSKRVSQIPAALEEIIMNCLSKDPHDRPESATRLRDALVGLSIEPTWDEMLARKWWEKHAAQTVVTE